MVTKLKVFFGKDWEHLQLRGKLLENHQRGGILSLCQKVIRMLVLIRSSVVFFIQDNPTFISLSEIYKEGCEKRNTDPEQPIAIYYEKLAQIQSRGYMFNHQSLREILKEVGEIFCTIYTVKNLQDRPNQLRVEIYSLSRYICSEITCQWVQ